MERAVGPAPFPATIRCRASQAMPADRAAYLCRIRQVAPTATAAARGLLARHRPASDPDAARRTPPQRRAPRRLRHLSPGHSPRPPPSGRPSSLRVPVSACRASGSIGKRATCTEQASRPGGRAAGRAAPGPRRAGLRPRRLPDRAARGRQHRWRAPKTRTQTLLMRETHSPARGRGVALPRSCSARKRSDRRLRCRSTRVTDRYVQHRAEPPRLPDGRSRALRPVAGLEREPRLGREG